MYTWEAVTLQKRPGAEKWSECGLPCVGSRGCFRQNSHKAHALLKRLGSQSLHFLQLFSVDKWTIAFSPCNNLLSFALGQPSYSPTKHNTCWLWESPYIWEMFTLTSKSLQCTHWGPPQQSWRTPPRHHPEHCAAVFQAHHAVGAHITSFTPVHQLFKLFVAPTWYIPTPMCFGSILTNSARGSWSLRAMETGKMADILATIKHPSECGSFLPAPLRLTSKSGISFLASSEALYMEAPASLTMLHIRNN